jgi:hypothetical protein
LKRLLSSNFPRLKDLRDRAFQGLRTSDNCVYVLRSVGTPHDGMLPLQSDATGRVHEIEAEILKPLLSGEDIRAFSLVHRDQWILFPYDLTGSAPELLTEKQLRKRYPGAWTYLRECEDRLRARERGKMNTSNWWAFGRNQNLDQFEQPKIMLPDYHDRPAASVDFDGRFYSITAYCVTLRRATPLTLPILAALLNSDLLFWFLSIVGTALQRGFVRFMPQYLDKLPIVLPGRSETNALQQLVHQAMSRGYPNVRSAVNEVVYGLYGLTNEEIAIVEEIRNETRAIG